MPEIEISHTETVEVKFLKVEAEVRYWEDATVNGQGDAEGQFIPCRIGDEWCPVINLDTSVIHGWPEGTIADIHYKVCDAGRYSLLNSGCEVVKSIDGYVPDIMCPAGGGYGDYIIMHVGPDGAIANFNGDDLDDFAGGEN